MISSRQRRPAARRILTGLRPMTPDGTPVVGATRYDNLFLNTGHGTLGWTMACGSGKLVADQVMGQRPAIRADDLGLSRYDRGARAAAAGAGRQGRLSPTDVCLQRRPEAGAFIRPARRTIPAGPSFIQRRQ